MAKTKKTEESEAPQDQRVSKNLLNSLLNGYKEDHYNFVSAPQNKVISSGSLLLDSLIKIRTGSVVRLLGKGAELGKAQPLFSNVLTPTGWRNIGSLKVGDDVINSDGKSSKVLGVYPQGIRKINKVIFSDNTEAFCCDEHLWYTRTLQNRKSGKLGSVKSLQEIKLTLKKRGGTHNNHSIPYVRAVDFNNNSDLLLDSYLMGLFLGDGCFRHKYCVGFSSSDEEIIGYIKELLPDYCKIVKHHKNSKYNYLIHSIKLLRIFEHYGLRDKLSYEKFIPKDYLFASVEDRKKILQGLMDTDGTPHKRSGKSKCSGGEFSTTSYKLSEDVKFIAMSLGGRVKVNSRYTYYTHNGIKKRGKLSYRVKISFSDFCPFRLERKAKQYCNRTIKNEKFIKNIIPYGETECVCIKVSSNDNLYITDGFNLTHNTSECFVLAGNYMQSMSKSKTMFVMAEARLSEEMRRRSGLKFVEKPDEWDYGTVFVFKCNVFEVVAQVIETMLKTMYEHGETLCIIIDALDGLILRNDLSKNVWEGDTPKVAGVPLLTKLLFKRIANKIVAYDALLLVTSQYTAEIKLDPYSSAPPRLGEASGGSNISHQADTVIQYLPRFQSDFILENPNEKPDFAKNKIIGVYATIEIKKSSTDVSGTKIKIPIKKGKIGNQIWRSKEIGDMILGWGLASRSTAWISFEDDIIRQAKEANLEIPPKIQGINSLYEFLDNNEGICNWFYDKFKEIMARE